MKLICKNDIIQVYDDGDYYRYVWKGREDELISKTTKPQLPLALVLKWGFTAVDVDYLNNLSDNLEELYKNRFKRIQQTT